MKAHCKALPKRASIIEGIVKDMKTIGKDFADTKRCNVSFCEIDIALSNFQKEIEESEKNESFTSSMFSKDGES